MPVSSIHRVRRPAEVASRTLESPWPCVAYPTNMIDKVEYRERAVKLAATVGTSRSPRRSARRELIAAGVPLRVALRRNRIRCRVARGMGAVERLRSSAGTVAGSGARRPGMARGAGCSAPCRRQRPASPSSTGIPMPTWFVSPSCSRDRWTSPRTSRRTRSCRCTAPGRASRAAGVSAPAVVNAWTSHTGACSASAGRRHGPDRRASSSAPTSCSTCSRRCRPQRAAIVLRYWHDLDEREIASALGCRPGTVGSLLHREPRGFERSSKGDRKEIRDVIES